MPANREELESCPTPGLKRCPLDTLERAGVVVTRRAGREKLHFLNPVPIRMIHDRWIDRYTERHVSALLELKTELEAKAWRQNRRPA